MKNRAFRRSLALLPLGLCIWLVWPVEALATALVRFIHAVPGVGNAAVVLNPGPGEQNMGTVGFAQSTSWRSLRTGRFRWSLVGGGKTLAQGDATVGNGAYDLIVLARSAGVSVGVFKARAGAPGASLVRVIHAAPELGAPQLALDSKAVVASLSFTRATPYMSVNPGVHSLSAMKIGDRAPLLSVKGVKLTTGVAYSAVVVGSRGQRLRVVTLTDRGAPLTRPVDPTKHQGSGSSRPATGSVTVGQGDSLWTIAARQLGPGASETAINRELVAIWNLNAGRIGTGDPNLIFAGQRLLLP